MKNLTRILNQKPLVQVLVLSISVILPKLGKISQRQNL